MAAPSTTTTALTGTWVTTAMTSAVVKRRMPSARDRVIRKITADSDVTLGPKRRCSSSYEVKSSPRKYAGMNRALTMMRPIT